MTFKIDTETFRIQGRKGDSGVIKFIFNRNLSEFDVYFTVKASLDDADENALITKTFLKPFGSEIVVNLSPEDTSKFQLNCSKVRQFTDFFWGLKVVQGDFFAQTVVPSGSAMPPRFRVYQQIIGGKND